MDLIILGGPARPGMNPAYRGEYRAHPGYCDEVPDDDEINRLFLWYIHAADDDGLVSDYDKAVRFAELWNRRCDGPDAYEVVEVTKGNAPPAGNGKFLGFDVPFLAIGCLEISPSQVAALKEPDRTLDELMVAYFRPRRNHNLLFDNYEDAAFLLRVLKALNTITPDSVEGGDLSEYEVVGLWKLWPEQG